MGGDGLPEEETLLDLQKILDAQPADPEHVQYHLQTAVPEQIQLHSSDIPNRPLPLETHLNHHNFQYWPGGFRLQLKITCN